MTLNNKYEALQAAVEVAKAYAGSSAQNKVEPEKVLENVYKKIMEILDKK
jgi:hypothetical protein